MLARMQGEELLYTTDGHTNESLWKKVWHFFRKLKIEVSYAPGITLLGQHPKEINISLSNRYLHTLHCLQ